MTRFVAALALVCALVSTLVHAAQPFPNPKFRAFDTTGNPLSGGLLYTYAAGTTTPLATYTTSGGGVANTNPVVLNANGEADVWLTAGSNYKFVLKNSVGVTQWTVDNLPSPAVLNTLSDGTLRLPDGTASIPSLGFINETNTGFYRVGSHDLGVTINGTKLADWTTAGLSIAAPGASGFALTSGLTTSNTIASFLASGLTDANFASFVVGRAATNNNASVLSYLPNATAAASEACLDVYGKSQTLCVDGNAKIHVGANGTALGQILYSAPSLNFGTINAAPSCTSVSTTVTGAQTTGVCSTSGYNYGVAANSTTMLTFSCRVSAADTVIVQFCNNSAGVQNVNTITVPITVIQP